MQRRCQVLFHLVRTNLEFKYIVSHNSSCIDVFYQLLLFFLDDGGASVDDSVAAGKKGYRLEVRGQWLHVYDAAADDGTKPLLTTWMHGLQAKAEERRAWLAIGGGSGTTFESFAAMAKKLESVPTVRKQLLEALEKKGLIKLTRDLIQPKINTEESVRSKTNDDRFANIPNLDKIDTVTNRTLLMQAASMGLVDVVFQLLDKGAGVNAENNIGETALSYAVFGNHVDVIQLLLKYGAKVDMAALKQQAAHMAALKGCRISDVVNEILGSDEFLQPELTTTQEETS